MTSSEPVTLTSLRSERPRMSVPRGGNYFNIDRKHAYDLAARGEFPVPVHKIGARFYVLTTDVARALGVDPRWLLEAPEKSKD